MTNDSFLPPLHAPRYAKLPYIPSASEKGYQWQLVPNF
jgi:hypothetical protein